jgi:hypothetical protein
VGIYIWIEGPQQSSGNYVKMWFELPSRTRRQDGF